MAFGRNARLWFGRFLTLEHEVHNNSCLSTRVPFYAAALWCFLVHTSSALEDAASPRINRVVPSSNEMGRYEKLELTLDIKADFSDPFDPAQIDVTGHFVAPSGNRVSVPGFYYQDYKMSLRETTDNKGHAGEEVFTPNGDAVWKIRFSPTELGAYTYTVTVKDKKGTVQSTPGKFTSVASENPGYIRVSAKDPRYLEFDNGEPFWALGLDMPSGSAHRYVSDYDSGFKKCRENGINYAMVWLVKDRGWFKAIEWGADGLGKYDQKACFRAEKMLEAAERNGVYINFVLDSWRAFINSSDVRGENPYYTKFGGMCAKELDFFVLPEAKKYYKRRHRYIIARWGYSTHIANWELWSEINCVRGFNPQTIIDWSREMARYFKTIDPGKHIVTNSYGSYMVEPLLWSAPEMEIAKVHGYYKPNEARPSVQRRGRDMADFVPYWISQITGFGKPALFNEWGMVNERWGSNEYALKDREGIHVHNAIWASAHTESAGTAMAWCWETIIRDLDLWRLYKPLANYLSGTRWTEWNLRSARLTCSDEAVRVLALKNNERIHLWIQNKQNTWYRRLVEKEPIRPIEGASLWLGPLKIGRYRVEWWDTEQGVIQKTEHFDYSNVITYHPLKLPKVEKDIAVKVYRVAAAPAQSPPD